MIWRVANAFRPSQPINFDRALAGSYNTRSVLEALLAHTPQFYTCFPGRIESIASFTKIKKGHKHLVWEPNSPHREGVIVNKETKIVISEIPNQEVMYDALVFPDEAKNPDLDIDIQRRHAQIQIALIMIGLELERDKKHRRALRILGLKVLVLWECEVERKLPRVESKLTEFLSCN